MRISRLLLSFAALVLILGAAAHAAAFPRAAATIDAAALPAFIANSCKALWLADSCTLLGSGLVFAFVALRPAAASGIVVMLVALIPAATAALVYAFVGPFYAAHILAAAAAAAFVGGLLLRQPGGLGAPAVTTSWTPQR
jgi:hypothetical protein